MAASQNPGVHSRKTPQQSRSLGLVAAVLEAAGRVLAKEGARRFTIARVAETAGVSVGSVYQYFPNKAAILFRLQSEEWRRTVALMTSILARDDEPASVRIRRLTHAFVASEIEERLLRGALNDAAPFYRDAPEVSEAWTAASRVVEDFLGRTLASVAAAEKHVFAAGIFTASLGEVGRRISEITQSECDAGRYADALADMLCAYVDTLQRGAPIDGADAR